MTGEGLKKTGFIYLKAERNRYITRAAISGMAVVLAGLGVYFLWNGEMGFLAQLIPMVWLWYFTRRLVSGLYSEPLVLEPAMAYNSAGLWTVDPAHGNGFVLLKWDEIRYLEICHSRKGFPARFECSSRAELGLGDGRTIPVDGLQGTPRYVCDRLGEWLPVRKIKLR